MSIKRLWFMAVLVTTAAGCGDGGDGPSNSVEGDNPDSGIRDAAVSSDGDAEISGDGDGDAAINGDGGDDHDAGGDGDADADAGDPEPIEIAGTWYNVTLDLVETFSSMAITGDFEPVEIAAYDNELNVMVLRFDDEEDPSRSLYTKVVWLEPDASGFYYCPVAFELTSVEEALAAEDTSDAGDLETGGCDGGPWTRDVPLDEMP